MDIFWKYWPFKRDTSSYQQSRRSTARPRSIASALSPWESNMVTLQSVIIWEKPARSALTIVAVNIIFWMYAMSNVGVVQAVSVIGLAAFLHHQWVHSIWPEISIKGHDQQEEGWTPVNPSVLSAPEISRHVESFVTGVKEWSKWGVGLRRRQPTVFCILVCSTFGCLATLGYMVSGLALVYLTAMTVLTVPPVALSVAKCGVWAPLKGVKRNIFGASADAESPNESELAEFLPEETSVEAQVALEVPFLEKDPPCATPLAIERKKNTKKRETGRKNKMQVQKELIGPTEGPDSSYFASGLQEDEFPSLEVNSSDEFEEQDLALTIPPDTKRTDAILSEATLTQGGHESLLSEGEKAVHQSEASGMRFVSSHFGGSSDEEEDFERGLSFGGERSAPSHDETDGAVISERVERDGGMGEVYRVERKEIEFEKEGCSGIGDIEQPSSHEEIEASSSFAAHQLTSPPLISLTNPPPTTSSLGDLVCSVVGGQMLSSISHNLMSSVMGELQAQSTPHPHSPPASTSADSTPTLSSQPPSMLEDVDDDFEFISDEEL